MGDAPKLDMPPTIGAICGVGGGIAIALCCFHTPYLPGDKEAKAEEAKQNMAKVELAKQSFGGIYKTPEECSKELAAIKGAEIAGVAAV